jgi:hypothetical protein
MAIATKMVRKIQTAVTVFLDEFQKIRVRDECEPAGFYRLDGEPIRGAR